MNNLISDIFGDLSIFFSCGVGECFYYIEVFGYVFQVFKINMLLIVGVIVGCVFFLVGVIFLIWYLFRRQFKYGFIYLDDLDDEVIKFMVDYKLVFFYFQNVFYNLNGKYIFLGIQGMVYFGEIMVIMGVLGVGKIIFLDILVCKNKCGQVFGDFYVNGEKVSDVDYKNVVGFVDQEDIMLFIFMVYEIIMISVFFCLLRDMGRVVKEQRVVEVEKQLGIYYI